MILGVLPLCICYIVALDCVQINYTLTSFMPEQIIIWIFLLLYRTFIENTLSNNALDHCMGLLVRGIVIIDIEVGFAQGTILFIVILDLKTLNLINLINVH